LAKLADPRAAPPCNVAEIDRYFNLLIRQSA